jgi:hypothetical protein
MPGNPRAFLVAFFLALAAAVRAAEPASTLTRTDLSPSGAFRIEHHRNAEFEFTLWLISAKDPKQKRALFQPNALDCRDPEVLISPDEQSIIRTQTRGSTCITAILHRRKGPLDYRLARDLEKPAWRFLADSLLLDPVPPFHRTLAAVRWLDARTVLLRLSGDTPFHPRVSLANWYCAYDVEKKTFRVPQEFRQVNARALVLAESGK